MTLFVTCGLPGAGKSTRARELEAQHNAIRLTTDDWMRDLWDQEQRALIEQRMWETAQRLLSMGVDVIIDFGVWSRAERDVLREYARSVGARVELHYLEEPIDELERRVTARNREGITRTHLEEWAAIIEVPTAEELALFDAHAHSCGRDCEGHHSQGDRVGGQAGTMDPHRPRRARARPGTAVSPRHRTRQRLRDERGRR